MPDKRKRSRKRRLRQAAAGLLLLTAALMIGAAVATPGYVGRHLNSYMLESSRGDYQLRFSDLKANLYTQTVELDSIRLIPIRPHASHYLFKAEKLKASGLSVWSFLLKRKLRIDLLQLVKPEFEVVGNPGQKRDAPDKSELFARLQPFFNRSLRGISIGEIRLDQAQVAHFRLGDQINLLNSINELNIGIVGFRIDSAILSKREEFFKADDIYLKIRNFERMMGDSLHRLEVGELTYSIANKSISGENFNFYPIDSTRQNATRYWIRVPQIGLKSENLRDILGNDSVRVDSVRIRHANIRVKPRQDGSALNFRKLNEYDLFEVVKNDFNYIRIKQLELEADRLVFAPRSENKPNSQDLRDICVQAFNFELDEHSADLPQKILYSDRFDLQIGKYSLNLNDGVHRFDAANMQVSSTKRLIRARDMALLPVNHPANVPVSVELHCDSMSLLEIDFPGLFHRRELNLQALQLYHPAVTMNQRRNPMEKAHDEQSLLYNFISDYIRGVYAREVTIGNGRIEFNDLRSLSDAGRIESDFGFTLNGFSLDSASARQNDKLFYAAEMELDFKNYRMKLADQLHFLLIAEVQVSSRNHLATITGLQLAPDRSKNAEATLASLNRSELYNIRIPRMQLQHTDIHHAFFRKKLDITRFVISKPQIDLEVFASNRRTDDELSVSEFYGLIHDYITDITIGDIAFDDGEFRFVNHNRKGKTINLTNKFSLNLHDFRLNEHEINSNRTLLSDHFELKIIDHLFRLSDNVHLVKAAEISFSSANASCLIRDAMLFPDPASAEYRRIPWQIQVSIPRIELNRVDLKQALHAELLDVGSVRLLSPVIRLTKNRKGDGQFNFKELTVPLPRELRELRLGQVSLENGALLIEKNEGANPVKLASAKLDFKLNEARMKRSSNRLTARFSAESISTGLTGLLVTPPGLPMTIGVERIQFESATQNLSMSGVSIANTGDRQYPLIGVNIPKLSFEQIDPAQTFDQNRIHAGRIVVSDPEFSFRSDRKERSRNPLQIALPPDAAPLIDELSAEQVQVNNATFNLVSENKTHRLDQVDIRLDGVQLDQQPSVNLFGASSATLVRRNLHYTDADDLYDILIDRFAWQSAGNEMALSGIHIIPRFNQSQFQRHIEYQQDYYSGDIREIRFDDIDLNRWFTRQEFTGKTIAIDQVNMLVFRDKRKPVDPNHYPPMPQQAIRNIDLPFYFDTLKLTNSTVVYTEQLEQIPEPGRVSFEKLGARVYPFTNQKTDKPADRFMNLSAWANLMGASKLTADIRFDMNSPVNRFEARGSLSPFDLTTMNPMTENGASISVRSGYLNRFDFEFSGDSVSANGKLRFLYEDLKITILAHKNGNTKEARFLSFLANSLMLRANSPRSKIFIPDEIHYRRDPNKSTLNYWWKAVFSGAKNTFGVKDEPGKSEP